MKLTVSTIFSRAAGIILAAFVLTAALPQSGFAQPDPMIGKWNLNLTKSTFRPGPAPRSTVLTVEPAGQGLRLVADSISAAGMPTSVVFTIVYDGMPHPITGSQLVDANAARKTDARTFEYANTKGGALTQTGTVSFAQDGKSLTIATRGVNAQGARVDNLAFYDKQ